MNKYTPGPWEARDECGPFTVVAMSREDRPTVVFLGARQSGIGALHGRQEIEANARLIAAAPELLEALQAALEHLEYCGWGDSWERECAEDAGLPDMITAAIAKATTGGTQ